VSSGSDSRFEVKPYFTAAGAYALEKQVGKESYPIGNLNYPHFNTSSLTVQNRAALPMLTAWVIFHGDII
jgi:hypothetical protein